MDPDPVKIAALEDPGKRLIAAHRAVLAAEVLAHKLRVLRHEAVLELWEGDHPLLDIGLRIGVDASRASDLSRPPKDGRLRQALVWPVPFRNTIRAHSDPGASEKSGLEREVLPGWVRDLD